MAAEVGAHLVHGGHLHGGRHLEALVERAAAPVPQRLVVDVVNGFRVHGVVLRGVALGERLERLEVLGAARVDEAAVGLRHVLGPYARRGEVGGEARRVLRGYAAADLRGVAPAVVPPFSRRSRAHLMSWYISLGHPRSHR